MGFKKGRAAKEVKGLLGQFCFSKSRESIKETVRDIASKEVEELEQKLESTIKTLEPCREKENKLQLEVEVKKNEVLTKNKASSDCMTPLYPKLSFSEIKEAISNFDPSMKFGEDTDGTIYRDILRGVLEVAVKIVDANSLQGLSEFQQETERDIASKEVEELEQKLESTIKTLEPTLQPCREEENKLQVKLEVEVKKNEMLTKNEASSGCMTPLYPKFSISEIEEATSNFDLSMKLGEGAYRSIYRGILRGTEVAVKILDANSLQGLSEFQQEVDVLSKLRHPNIVSFIGACPEACILVYEYLPNGNLEDRLSCKDNTPPLSWKIRVCIAAELCAAVRYIHSFNIAHVDLKPANILLGLNFIAKLGDFGISHSLFAHEASSSNSTPFIRRTEPKGTYAYMDPEFAASGVLTTKSDVYSFGVTLLQLLTGRPATLGIIKEVGDAFDSGNLENLLDPLAGDWPFLHAKRLARLALRCCRANGNTRPDIAVDAWRVLKPMRDSCGYPSLSQLGSQAQRQPPSYFMCPILQEVMQDPQVAADGFTYEGVALKEWLDCGHDTSPMTNLRLEHNNMVPNRLVRSIIQEWQQQN